MDPSVADFLLERMSVRGMSRIDGYPGDGIGGIIGALDPARDRIELVPVRHEEPLGTPAIESLRALGATLGLTTYLFQCVLGYGFALAVGVLIDAFVVRSLLVPALISLFGDVSWGPGTRRVRRLRLAAEPTHGEHVAAD